MKPYSEICIGIDGTRRGWVAVYLGNNQQRFALGESIRGLLAVPHARAMMDIPLGFILVQRSAKEAAVAHKSWAAGIAVQ